MTHFQCALSNRIEQTGGPVSMPYSNFVGRKRMYYCKFMYMNMLNWKERYIALFFKSNSPTFVKVLVHVLLFGARSPTFFERLLGSLRLCSQSRFFKSCISKVLCIPKLELVTQIGWLRFHVFWRNFTPEIGFFLEKEPVWSNWNLYNISFTSFSGNRVKYDDGSQERKAIWCYEVIRKT